MLSDLFHRDRCRPILARLAAEPPGAVVTSAIVAHELAYGAARSARRAENERRFASLLADVEPLPFTLEDARAAGKIRAALAAAGTPIGPYDALVAGQARARGLVVVTGDTREFARVEGLETDDWRGGSGGDEGLR